MSTVTLNNGVEMPALGLGVFQTPPEETRAAVEAALATGYRHIDTAAAYGNEREVGEAVAKLGHRPIRRLPGDQDLDQRLRVRRDAARLREERRQARRRPDRPADPAPGPAVGVRQDPGGVPRAGDAARRRQGPRHRRQQLHGRAPHHAAGAGDRRAGGEPDRGAPLLPAARGAGLRRRARHPHPGVVAHRRHHLLPRRPAHQHPAGPGHRRDRAGARQDARAGDAALAPAAGPLGDPEVDQARSASRRTSTSSTSSSPASNSRRSTASTPEPAAARSPSDITLANFGRPIPEA